jgi:uncharacterized membrane protein
MHRARIEKSIVVDVPARTAYNQWTQFEEFPEFMEGVVEVRQLGDTHLHWVAEIGGKRHEWDAEIVEQRPDDLVSWRSVGGKGNAGLVRFRPLDENRTEMEVEIEWQAEGMVEQLGSALGADERRVEGDLERFKELIERRGVESGAWRGQVEQGSVTSGDRPSQ